MPTGVQSVCPREILCSCSGVATPSSISKGTTGELEELSEAHYELNGTSHGSRVGHALGMLIKYSPSSAASIAASPSRVRVCVLQCRPTARPSADHGTGPGGTWVGLSRSSRRTPSATKWLVRHPQGTPNGTPKTVLEGHCAGHCAGQPKGARVGLEARDQVVLQQHGTSIERSDLASAAQPKAQPKARRGSASGLPEL